jgi:hypothetical protein
MTPQRAWRNYMRGEISALDRRVEKFRRRYDPAFYRPDHRPDPGIPRWERVLDRALAIIEKIALAFAIVIFLVCIVWPFLVWVARHSHVSLYGGWLVFPMLLTRACAWCDAGLGEKCPECGGGAVELAYCKLLVDCSPATWFACMNARCGVRRFVKGEGGVTHGICDACSELEKKTPQMPQTPQQLEAAGGVMAGAAGLEPATPCLEGRCSIHLSYAPGAALFRLSDYRTDATLPPVERAARLQQKAIGLVDQSANEMQKSVNLGYLLQERQKRRGAGGAR